MIKYKLKTNQIQETETSETPLQIIERIEQKCKQCTVLTPITCSTRCENWKIKRQLRSLHEAITKHNYMISLLNALKNKRRLHILGILSGCELSLTDIQKELKSRGYNHSQKTITEEYIAPLVKVGLIEQRGARYRLTIFGSEINKFIKDLDEIAEVFPPHSECYEENALSILMEKPRTYNELEQFIPSKSLARVLQRLQDAQLIYTPKERAYVFYFKTRRDPTKLEFSPTERKVYSSIPDDGIAVGKLAEKIGISIRRTYKYLRRLKRKKLVFSRKKPKTYALTNKGFKIAAILMGIKGLVADFLAATAKLTNDKKTLEKIMPDAKKHRKRRREKETPPLIMLVHAD